MGELSLERAMEIVKVKKPSSMTEPGSEWPKVFYHAKLAPRGQIFSSQKEIIEERDAGWSEVPIPPGK